ncbi:hypothetical protein ACT8ZV_08650 [Nocardioides sp. MAHUQ-72]|uniref:hypothetical protein n=1 Tax=unclassified Nocardioides TaxID=2615069 RepID=UPI003623E6FE
MDHQDEHIGQLLVQGSPPSPSDPQRLVAAGITRGRALRRRQRAGTAAAALAVFGVIGVGAVVVPLGGGDRSTPVASDPTPSPTPSAPPSSTPLPTPTSEPSVSTPPSASVSTPPSASVSMPPPTLGDTITVAAPQVPATVGEILGRDGAGELRTSAPYSPASGPDTLVAHFSWQGTLTTVVIEPAGANPQRDCRAGGQGTTCSTDADGDPVLTWGPTTADRVTAQGATVWQNGFQVSALSYNAADGKDAAPLTDAPPLSLDDLTAVAGSDVWFY